MIGHNIVNKPAEDLSVGNGHARDFQVLHIHEPRPPLAFLPLRRSNLNSAPVANPSRQTIPLKPQRMRARAEQTERKALQHADRFPKPFSFASVQSLVAAQNRWLFVFWLVVVCCCGVVVGGTAGSRASALLFPTKYLK